MQLKTLSIFITFLAIMLFFCNSIHAQHIEYPSIEISSPSELDGLKDYLQNNFRNMYSAVSQKLLLAYHGEINCILVTKLSEMEHILEVKLGQPITLKDSIAGVAVKSLSLIILNARAFRDQPFINAEKTFRHELAHLMLGAIETKGELPYWFEEGVCQWAEQLLFYPTFREKSLYASIEGAPTIAQIESMMKRRENLDRAYISAFNSVEFLLRNNSISRLPDFYFNFTETGDFEKSFQQAFSETVLQFEKRWHEHLSPNTPSRIVNFLGANWFTVLFGFGGIVIIFAYFKRRKIFKNYMKRYERLDKIEDKEYDDSHKWLREIEHRRKQKGLPEPKEDEDWDPEV